MRITLTSNVCFSECENTNSLEFRGYDENIEEEAGALRERQTTETSLDKVMGSAQGFSSELFKSPLLFACGLFLLRHQRLGLYKIFG
ncbi:hypothetical protein L2E82_32071 [Cichorium intybus]|uniref:Uncharacterized protein n=1 Tax=Cichorium intybus TaxID=13427 RepID=A0ACB9BHN0_CICIN|nr:hypothetical protein L2E82_32071 [Cichorium intybus]